MACSRLTIASIALLSPAFEPWRSNRRGESEHLPRCGRKRGSRLARLRQFEQEFHVRTSSTVDALDFRVFRFNDVVLVRSVRAASVAEAKASCGAAQGIAGENGAAPGAGVSREKDGHNAAAAIGGGLHATDCRIR